ncbi:hypothetical protein [Rhodoplanes sp. SY1]|uniref:hypothetical protein n=1 Tax=Rhodoplanes sp. SY1 TaxID=3166646 RepID=UPI0038B4D5E2
MAGPTIRNASGRPARHAASRPWSSRGATGPRVPAPIAARPRPPGRPAPLWPTVAAPLTFLAVAVAVAGVMTVWMSSRAPSPPKPSPPAEPELSAAEAVKLRFVPELLALAVPDAPGADFAERFGGGAGASGLGAAPGGPVSAYAALPATPAAPEPGRARPSNALLNDAQIASIKTRLKLTAEQERLWGPVETALRGVVWRRSADRRGTAPAVLETQSLERLRTAATPFVGTLREDQKREIRSLSHVMGLGELVDKL